MLYRCTISVPSVFQTEASEVQNSSETKTNLNLPAGHLVTSVKPSASISFISGAGARADIIMMFQTLYSEKTAADAALTGWRKMLSKAGIEHFLKNFATFL